MGQYAPCAVIVGRSYFVVMSTQPASDSFEQQVLQQFGAIDQRFEAIDQRFEAIDQRLETIDGDLKRFYNYFMTMAISVTVMATGAIFAAAGVVIFKSLV